ncbi:MAG: hypothetical protein ACFFCO_08395 [Promethearchaeota archaeon]
MTDRNQFDVRSEKELPEVTAVDEDNLAAIIREFGRSMREVTSGLDDAMSRWESTHRNSLRPIRVILGALSKINFLKNLEDLGKLASFEGIIDKAVVKNLGELDKLLPKLLALAPDFEGVIRKMRLMTERVSGLQRKAAELLQSTEKPDTKLRQLVDNVESLAQKLRTIVAMYEDEYLFRMKVIGNIEELIDPKELYTHLLLWTLEPYLESERIETIRKEIGTHIETTRSLVSTSTRSKPLNVF